MIAPNRVVLITEPHRSVVSALLPSVAKNGPSGAWLTSVARTPPKIPNSSAKMSNRPVTIISDQEARHDQVLDRVDAHDHQRVELVADLARAEVGGDRGAGDSGHHDRGHERRELPDRGEDEEAAEAVQRAEQRERVGRLQPGRLVAERDRREQHRKPADAQREQELLHELDPVRIRRASRPTRSSWRSGRSCRRSRRGASRSCRRRVGRATRAIDQPRPRRGGAWRDVRASDRGRHLRGGSSTDPLVAIGWPSLNSASAFQFQLRLAGHEVVDSQSPAPGGDPQGLQHQRHAGDDLQVASGSRRAACTPRCRRELGHVARRPAPAPVPDC